MKMYVMSSKENVAICHGSNDGNTVNTSLTGLMLCVKVTIGEKALETEVFACQNLSHPAPSTSRQDVLIHGEE
jgi:hypothetical protein